MKYFDKTAETMPLSKKKELQLSRLKNIVNFAYDKVPFYRSKFEEIGLKPSHIQSLKDIAKIPFTTKDDFRDTYPYGLLAVPLRDIVRIHASSGTTGKPIVAGYTKNDLNIWSEIVARFLVASGGSEDDIVQISFGYGLFTGALGLHQGWERIGATVIPISSGNTERQIMMMKDLKATALVSTPSYGLYIAETLYKIGYTKDDIFLRLGYFGAEASTKETHEQLQKLLNVKTCDNYGLTEIIGPGVSGECSYQTGMHIADDHFYPEILDKNTFEPLNDGEYGELVLTTLTKEGMPILRYRTKDITRLIPDVCPCGRTTVRMDKIKGRTDDMLIIRGVNLFPSQIEAVLMSMDEVGNHYEIVVQRENFLDTIEVKIEVMDEKLLFNFSMLEALRKKVHDKLYTTLQLDVRVKLVEPLSLKRFEGKAKRVLDLRNQ